MTFLSVAQQGKNSWKRYLLGILIATCAPLVMLFLLLIPITIGLAIFLPTLLEKNSIQDLMAFSVLGFPISYFFGIGILIGLFVVTLKYVVERIHQRNFFTLLNAEPGAIDWKRIGQGFLVNLGSQSAVPLISYLINPQRYRISFNAPEWLFSAGFSLLLTAFVAIFFCLFFYSYLLQEMGLLIRKPVRLAIVYGLLIGTLTAFFSPQTTVLRWMIVVLVQMFCVWLVLKENCLELLMGYRMSNVFYSCAILQANTDKPQFSTILKRVAEPAPDLLNLLFFISSSALFYYICFYFSPKKVRNPN